MTIATTTKNASGPMQSSIAMAGGMGDPAKRERDDDPDTEWPAIFPEMKRAGTSQHRPASLRIELPGMDSNHDEEYQKLNCPDRNGNPSRNLHSPDTIGRTTGRTEEAETIDAELIALVSAWHGLPLPIRAAIRALIGTV